MPSQTGQQASRKDAADLGAANVAQREASRVRLNSPTLRRVVETDLCSGCGLCASVSRGAVDIISTPPGYNRPVQRAPLSPEAERTIAEACPGSVVEPWRAAPQTHPYWGPYHQLTTGYATDPEIRFLGSSGGAVTALAAHALRTGLVDRVIHIGAHPADPAGNHVLVSRTVEEVVAGAGSRYVASSPLIEIDQALSEGGAIAFVGKPCDASALRRLGRIDPRVQAHVKLVLAFYCAGIPSRRAVSRLLSAMSVDPGELVAFRYRGEGWPGRAKATLRSGAVSDMSYEDSWGGHLSKEVQFRCKICPDAVGGVADIACADAWYGGETGYPTFEELDGRSLIMSRTQAGDDFLRAAVAEGAVVTEPLPPGDIDLMQPGQARRKRLVRGRLAALTATLQATPIVKGLLVEEASRAAGVREQVRNFLGSLRRCLRARRGVKP